MHAFDFTSSWWRHALTKALTNALATDQARHERTAGALLGVLLLSACGGGGGGGGGLNDDGGNGESGGGGVPVLAGFGNARSTLCGEATGLSAIYYDLINGIPRSDLPFEATLPPEPFGGVVVHPAQPLLGFQYPAGWTPTLESDPAIRLAGANLVRADNRAVWRYSSYFLVNAVPAARDEIAREINLMLANLGNTAPVNAICSIDLSNQPHPAGVSSGSGRLLAFGDFRANVVTQIITTPIGTGSSTAVFTRLAVGPTAEFERLIFEVFLPIDSQLRGGGGGGFAACEDGIDNDGDNLIDENDPGCTSGDDEDERG